MSLATRVNLQADLYADADLADAYTRAIESGGSLISDRDLRFLRTSPLFRELFYGVVRDCQPNRGLTHDRPIGSLLGDSILMLLLSSKSLKILAKMYIRGGRNSPRPLFRARPTQSKDTDMNKIIAGRRRLFSSFGGRHSVE